MQSVSDKATRYFVLALISQLCANLEVTGSDDSVLVDVHDAEGFLELLDLLLGEVLEDVDLLLGLPAKANYTKLALKIKKNI